MSVKVKNELGGPGSGRQPEGGSKPESSSSDKVKPVKGEMSSRSDNGQIKVSKPKSVDEATTLLSEVNSYHEEAQSAYQKDPSPKNAMRAAHATAQLSRAISYGSKFANKD